MRFAWNLLGPASTGKNLNLVFHRVFLSALDPVVYCVGVGSVHFIALVSPARIIQIRQEPVGIVRHRKNKRLRLTQLSFFLAIQVASFALAVKLANVIPFLVTASSAVWIRREMPLLTELTTSASKVAKIEAHHGWVTHVLFAVDLIAGFGRNLPEASTVIEARLSFIERGSNRALVSALLSVGKSRKGGP